MEYPALFKEHKKVKTVHLVLATVFRLERRDDGITAHANVQSEDGQVTSAVKFWVSRKDRPCGSRRKVTTGRGQDHPFISHDKSDFECTIGTPVLTIRPRGDSAAFPVVSYDEYQKALKALERQVSKSEPPTAPLKKGQHRFP